MRDSYPSDISREQFEPLQAIFDWSQKPSDDEFSLLEQA